MFKYVYLYIFDLFTDCFIDLFMNMFPYLFITPENIVRVFALKKVFQMSSPRFVAPPQKRNEEDGNDSRGEQPEDVLRCEHA